MNQTVSTSKSASKKPNIIRRLYNWTIHWTETKYAGTALFCISFVESSFFPIPPDVLLIALCFSKPKNWFRYALVCSIASVLGGIFGWYLGHAFWEVLGPYFFQYVPGFTAERFQLVEEFFNKNAFLFILTAAFTPIPYKVFTIASGVFAVGLPILIGASVLGRSGRFFLVAILIRLGGPSVKPFIEKHLEAISFVFFILLVAGFYALRFLKA